MLKTKVVNIRDAVVGTIGKVTYIGRAGKGLDGYFGNPHPIGYCTVCKVQHNREQCVEAYKKDFIKRIEKDPEFKRRILSLKGHILQCFCAPQLCHGHVIAAWVDEHACTGCDGTRVVAFNRHGTLQQCGHCKGTGEEPK